MLYRLVVVGQMKRGGSVDIQNILDQQLCPFDELEQLRKIFEWKGTLLPEGAEWSLARVFLYGVIQGKRHERQRHVPSAIR